MPVAVFKVTEKEFKDKSLLDSNIDENIKIMKALRSNGMNFSSGMEEDLMMKKQQDLDKSVKQVFEHFNKRKRKYVSSSNMNDEE